MTVTAEEGIRFTSNALVEKFPTEDAFRAARRIVREAFYDSPKAFMPEGRHWSKRWWRRGPPEMYGFWSDRELVERQIETGLYVVEDEAGDRKLLVPRLRRNLARFAETFREFKILEALSLADGFALAYGNLFLNEGLNELWNLVCGAAATAYNNANAQLGVGDSTTAAAATQTDLQASTNKLFKAMDASFPTSGTSQKGTFKSTYGTSDANFAWQEWSVRNGSSEAAAKNINRKVESLGTKSTGTWTLTVDLSGS